MDCTPSSIFYGDGERNDGSDKADVVPPPPLTETERLAIVMERFDLNYTQIAEYRDTFDRLDTDNYRKYSIVCIYFSFKNYLF